MPEPRQQTSREPPSVEGYIDYAGYRTWYRVVGDPSTARRLPVVTVHGGPGSTHHGLRIHQGLARHGYPVVLYDQLGCGNSDRPDDPRLWTFELFLAELEALREALALERFHLLGHSWGGMLAMRFAVDHPEAVAGLVLASAPASVPRIAREARGLVAGLPPEIRDAIERHERAGTTDSPEYQEAVRAFNTRHICRMDPWPDDLLEGERRKGEQVYAVICGPSEFTIIGRAKEWDFTPQLGRIIHPTLITSGRYDEFTPAHAQDMAERIPDARWVCFEQSAHFPHLEEHAAYREVLLAFLEAVERGETTSALDRPRDP